jgi:hypothetical protein
MKITFVILIVFISVRFGIAQESSPLHTLLSSKGNIDVSKRFKESPVLPLDDIEAEIYRITFIPTFHNPIRIRIEKRKDDCFLVAKQLNGQGGYDAGKLKEEKRRRISLKDWNQLVDLLNQANFWVMPFEDKRQEPDEKGSIKICLDGSEWTLEGVKTGKYHAVSRYCPELKSFEAIGLFLAKLSELGVKERDLY